MLLICILKGKGLNKLWVFNHIYKSFVLCASNPFVACKLTKKISIFLMIE